MAKPTPQKQGAPMATRTDPLMASKSAGVPPPVMAPPPSAGAAPRPSLGSSMAGGPPKSSAVSAMAGGQPAGGMDQRKMAMDMLRRGA